MEDSYRLAQPVTREELTDRSGRRWMPREILALGRERFVNGFDGNYRFAIDLFASVARDGALEEARRLKPEDRAAFRTLDSVTWRLYDAGLQLVRELDEIGGGTALLGDVMCLEADREEMLRRCALAWSAPAAGAKRHWAETRRTLAEVLAPRRAFRDRTRWLRPPPDRAVVLRQSRRLRDAFDAIERIELSGYVRKTCADEIRRLALRIDHRDDRQPKA